jgi:hypothetical protein
MSNRQVYTPTFIERYQYPANAVYQKFVKGFAPTRVSASAADVGKEVHAAISDAFKYLESKKTSSASSPSDKEIYRWLSEARAQSANSLRLNQSQRHHGFVDNIVNSYGREYLKNQNLELLSEATLSGFDPSGKFSIEGRPDLAFIDIQKKSAQLIDFKNVFDARTLEFYSKAPVTWQTKANSYLLMQWVSKNRGVDLEEIQAVFNLNAPFATATNPSTTVGAGDIRKYGQELTDEISRIQAINENAYKIIRTSGKSSAEALKSHLGYLINESGTNPMDYTFDLNPFDAGRFISETLQKANAGVEDPSNPFNQFKQERRKDFARDIDSKWQEHLWEEKRDARLRSSLHASLESRQFDPFGRGDQSSKLDHAETLNKILRESSESVKLLKYGRFESSLTRGEIAAHAKLPYSLLDVGWRNAWASESTIRSMDYISRSIVRDIAQASGQSVPIVEKEVLDRVFKNRQFVGRLNSFVQDRIIQDLEKSNLIPNEENIRKALSGYRKTLDRSMASMVQDKVYEETIRTISNLDRAAIGKHIPEKEKFTSFIDEALGKGSGPREKTPGAIRAAIAKGEGAFSTIFRSKLGDPRFPLSTLAMAGILSYIAGTHTMRSMLIRKMEKSSEELSREDEVRGGEHLAAYSTVRRLLGSDFGSKWRILNPVSRLWSKMAAAGSRKLGDIHATNLYHSAEKSVRSAYHQLNRAIHLNDYDLSLATIAGVSAATSFTALGVLPHLGAGATRHYDSDYRKERLNRPIRINQTRDSQMQEPQSALRSGYKLHTAFGSPLSLGRVAAAVLERIPLSKIPEYLGRIADGAGAFYTRYLSHGETGIIKSLTAPDAGDRMADLAGGIRERIKTAAGSATVKIREAEQSVVQSYERSKIRSRVEGAFNQTTKIQATRTLEDTVAGAVVSPPNIPQHRRPSQMPVIEKPFNYREPQTIVKTRGSGFDRDPVVFRKDTRIGRDIEPFITENAQRLKQYPAVATLAPTHGVDVPMIYPTMSRDRRQPLTMVTESVPGFTQQRAEIGTISTNFAPFSEKYADAPLTWNASHRYFSDMSNVLDHGFNHERHRSGHFAFGVYTADI